MIGIEGKDMEDAIALRAATGSHEANGIQIPIERNPFLLKDIIIAQQEYSNTMRTRMIVMPPW
jgi:hypothetical protein